MSDAETFYITHDPLTGFPIDPPPPIPMPLNRAKRIIAQVAAQFDVTPAELTGPRRFAKLVQPRRIAMTRIRNELGYSFPHIGRIFGGRDHSTIIWNVRGGRPGQPVRVKQQERAA
jgi:hypothetical protein